MHFNVSNLTIWKYLICVPSDAVRSFVFKKSGGVNEVKWCKSGFMYDICEYSFLGQTRMNGWLPCELLGIHKENMLSIYFNILFQNLFVKQM